MTVITDYDKINKALEPLQSNLVQYGQGHCFAVSEIVQITLDAAGIKSKLVECSLTMISMNPPWVRLVGISNPNLKDSEVDTHMICVTETTPEFIVDLSVGHAMIIEVSTQEDEPLLLANHVSTNGVHYVYKQKARPMMPPMLNQNIVSRIRSDRELRKSVNWLKWAVIVSISISTLNASRGAYDFYQVYIDKENYWGPSQVEQLNNKILQLEEMIKLPLDDRGKLVEKNREAAAPE